jgi:valyl-tRNA synthetase
VQDPDTLDTWFSSGTWTFSTLGWPEKSKDFKRFHPTQVLETGYDILFFWIARMILMSSYATGDVPFEKVYLHGLVRDEQGRKMSKSLENIIDPLDVADKYGTDAVRLSLVIGNTAGNDLRLSEDKIGYFRNFTNKLWNISRFILMSAGSVKPSKSRPKPKTLADRWILDRLDDVVRMVTTDLDMLQFSRAGETLRDFTWNELADWYLELAKIEGKKDAMLAHLLRTILALWHPFMPFVTEEIYSRTFAKGKGDFLMIGAWPKAGGKRDKKSVAEFGVLKDVIVAIRNIRAQYKVAPAKKIDVSMLGGKKTVLLKKYTALICGMARVEKLSVVAKGKRPEKSAAAVVSGIQVFVPLGSLVDAEAEKVRLAEELRQAEQYLASLDNKLKNESFVSRAPAPVVAAERQKLAAQQEKVEKLKEQMEELG